MAVAADAQVEDPVALEVLVALEGDLEDGLCAVVKCARSVLKKSLISTRKKSIRFDGSFQRGLRLNLAGAQGFAPNISAPSEALSNVPGRLQWSLSWRTMPIPPVSVGNRNCLANDRLLTRRRQLNASSPDHSSLLPQTRRG